MGLYSQGAQRGDHILLPNWKQKNVVYLAGKFDPIEISDQLPGFDMSM